MDSKCCHRKPCYTKQAAAAAATANTHSFSPAATFDLQFGHPSQNPDLREARRRRGASGGESRTHAREGGSDTRVIFFLLRPRARTRVATRLATRIICQKSQPEPGRDRGVVMRRMITKCRQSGRYEYHVLSSLVDVPKCQVQFTRARSTKPHASSHARMA